MFFQAIASNAKKNINRHEYTSVLSIFPIVQHLRSIKPQFDLTLEVNNNNFFNFYLKLWLGNVIIQLDFVRIFF